MYHMKNIISSDERIVLPKCMYEIKNSMKIDSTDGTEINICDQVIKFLKKPQDPMMELEERQDKLLLKLDTLYERIKSISVLCKPTTNIKKENLNNRSDEILEKEIVIVLPADVLPWFLSIFIKTCKGINMTWHIHSTVDKEKYTKINNFFKKFQNLSHQQDAKVNVRLIVKSVSSASELKTSSLDIPIIGTVNIMRYLCLTFKNVAPYDYTDYSLESLLDQAFLLERVADKNKEHILSKIFNNCKNWIYKNEFSIVDLAVYNAVKQSQNLIRFVPKQWYDSCEKKFNI